MMPRARGISWRALAGAMILALVVVAATAVPAAATARQPPPTIGVKTKMSLNIVPVEPMVTRYSGAVTVAGISRAKHPNGVSGNTKKKAKRKAKRFCKNYLRGDRTLLDQVPVLVFSGSAFPELADFRAQGVLGFGVPVPNQFDFLSGTVPGFVRGEVILTAKKKIRIRGKRWRVFCDSAKFP